MENKVKSPSSEKRPSNKRKSTKVNTVTRLPRATNSPAVKPRRSSLKNSKTKRSFSEESTSSGIEQRNGIRESNCTEPWKLSSPVPNPSRPHNIDQLLQIEKLDTEVTSCTFNLEDLSDSEDVWIMDLPKLVDPQMLCGQTITLGDKSKLKIKEERYCTVAHDVDYNVTCVFNMREKKLEYKTVNIKPTGSLTVRRKLSGVSKLQPLAVHNSAVEIPENVKTRHPLFGIMRERRKRKRSCLK